MMGEAIQQKGAVLLLPEYKLERQQFEGILQKSVTVLAGIIQNLGLEPIGSEVEINVDLDTIGAFYGSVDMVLKDIHTTINIDYQDIADKALRSRLAEANELMAGCCVIMEVKTGAIKAIVNLSKDSDGFMPRPKSRPSFQTWR